MAAEKVEAEKAGGRGRERGGERGEKNTEEVGKKDC